jgi:mannose/fructose/N-acetylgalactosamine-specific phosphotransferase system component IIB
VGSNFILCANDDVASNDLQKKVMQMAAPTGIKVEISDIKTTSENLAAEAWPNANILLLVRNPIDLLRLVQNGLNISKVNIGGVRTPGATIKLNKVVLATPQELEAWKELDKRGIRLEVQFLPGEGVAVLNDVIQKM